MTLPILKLLTRFGGEVRFGSIATELRCPRYVRFSLNLGPNLAAGPCVDGSGLARTFCRSAALVGAAMCSASERGSHDRWP